MTGAPFLALVESLRLAWPVALLLLVLPWLAGRFLPNRAAGHDDTAAIYLPFADALPPGENSATLVRAARPLRFPLFFWAVFGLLVLACARPQWLEESPRRLVSGRDVLLVLDVSASMQTRDLKTETTTLTLPLPLTRLDAASRLGRRFLERRPGDRAGLIVFGSRPYLYTPLTHDLPALGQALDSVAVGLAGPETALGDALGLAVNTLAGEENPSRRPLGKVAIVISDGASNRGALSPQQAAWVAAQRGVRIHALGVGSDPDEATLKMLAEQGGGHYARATDVAAVAAFFAQVETLEPATRDAAEARWLRWHEAYWFPLGAAILLLLGRELRESWRRASGLRTHWRRAKR
jgi:Ca-activated chloride channel family protein